MSQENTVQVGINLDIIYTSIKYYTVIGVGIGILGIILLNQFGGGGIGGSIIGGFLSIVILSYAVLTAPIIAAFVGYVVNQQIKGDSRTKVINSAIANGVGYVVFGLILSVLLAIGVSVILESGGVSLGGDGSATVDGGTTSGGGSSLVGISNILTLVALMMVPNALIGGAVTAVSNNKGSTQIESREQLSSAEYNTQDVEDQDTSISEDESIIENILSINKKNPVTPVVVSVILTFIIVAIATESFAILIGVIVPPYIGGAIVAKYNLKKWIPLVVGVACTVTILGILVSRGTIGGTQDDTAIGLLLLMVPIFISYIGLFTGIIISDNGITLPEHEE